MRTLHVEADTWMHRLSPRLKLAVMATLGVGLFLTDRITILVPVVVVAALFYLQTGLAFAEALRRLRPALATIAVVTAFSLLFNPPAMAIVTVLRLTTLLLVASTVTATTTIAAFIDEITSLARPLEAIGLLRAADIGLAVGLVVRFVPEIVDRYRAIREAHQARGVRIRIVTTLGPLIILTLRDADSVAAAIDARGIRQR